MAKDIDNSGFPAKLAKVLPEGYQDTVESKETEEIKEEILKAEGVINETDKLKEEDEHLKAAKERLKELNDAYNDVLKCQRAKIKYCFYVLNSRGAV